MIVALEGSAAADPAVLVHHSIGAGDRERVLRYAIEAALSAGRSGAHTQAAAFYRIALHQGASVGPAQEAEILEAMAAECYLIDQLEQAIVACERAMRLREQIGDPGGVSANHHSLAVYQWYNANRSLAERHVSDAITALDPDEPAPQRRRARPSRPRARDGGLPRDPVERRRRRDSCRRTCR